MEYKKRSLFVDYIRGIAALMIVISHSAEFAALNHGITDIFFDDRFFWYKCLLSIQVPLFMMISGFSLPIINVDGRIDRDRLNNEWLLRKLKQLIIPFFVWIIIPRLFTHDWNGFIDYIINVYKSPDNAYWFLWSLFLNHALFYYSRKVIILFDERMDVHYPFLIRELVCDLSIILVFSIIPMIVPYKMPLFLPSIPYYYLFYITGHYIVIAVKRVNSIPKSPLFVSVSCVGIWVFMCYMWGKNDYTYYMGPAMTRVVDYVYRIVMGMMGTLWLVYFSYYICRLLNYQAMIIGKIGRNTIEIYILQNYFFNIFKTQSLVLDVFINIGCGLFISYFISQSLRKGKFGGILFGR